MSEDALEYVALQWATRIRDRPLPDGLEGVYDAERNEIILSDKLFAYPASVRTRT